MWLGEGVEGCGGHGLTTVRYCVAMGTGPKLPAIKSVRSSRVCLCGSGFAWVAVGWRMGGWPGKMSAHLDLRPVLAILRTEEWHPLHLLRVPRGHPEVQHNVADLGFVTAVLVDRTYLQLNRRPAGSVVLQGLPSDHPGLANAGGETGRQGDGERRGWRAVQFTAASRTHTLTTMMARLRAAAEESSRQPAG